MTLYHPALYDWSQPVDSWWELDRPKLTSVDAPALNTDASCDVAIIGGGYCGLSAAYHLALAGIDAKLLEAGDIGWGASGRNGGFCSIGASFLSPTELKSIYGESETLDFYRTLVGAVRLVEEISEHEAIDLRKQGNGVWTFAHKPSRLRELEDQATILRQIEVGARIINSKEFEHAAFPCTEQHGAIFEPVGFGLHPLSYCLGLAKAAIRRGAVLHSNSRVLTWRRELHRHVLFTKGGKVTAKRVIVATNGWPPEDLVPELAGRVLPIMSNIITTLPLPAEALNHWHSQAPASNTRSLLSYFRILPGKQLMFGGRGDTTGKPAGLIAMRQHLTKTFQHLFPHLTGISVTHSWRGFIAATRRLTPAIGELPHDPSTSYAFGCHGNGVAFMTWAGRELARRIAGDPTHLPAPISGLPPKFPLPALRLWALRAMLIRARIEDAL